MGQQNGLDLCRVDVFAAGDDQVNPALNDPQIAVFIEIPQVASDKLSVLLDWLRQPSLDAYS